MQLKIFFCQFPNPWTLRVSGMGCYTSKCEKSQNHCTLMYSTVQMKKLLVGSLKKNTTLEYSTRVVQEGDRRCEKSTLNDLAYLTPLRIPLMNPVFLNLICANMQSCKWAENTGKVSRYRSVVRAAAMAGHLYF